MTEIALHHEFDDLRQVDAAGREFWSARDLMALVDYDRWENFAAAVERAKVTCENVGLTAQDHFPDATKMVSLGSGAQRHVADVHLSRYGAYLVFMNGDPRKVAIAAAQTYFALQTRIAETTAPREMSRLELIDMARDSEVGRIAAEQRVAELAGPAAHAETFRAAEGLRTIGDVANDFIAYCRITHPTVKVLHTVVWDHAHRVGLVHRGKTVRHNEPTSQAIRAGWATPHRVEYDTRTTGTRTKVTTRLTPRGEARLWDAMVAFVLANGTLDIAPKAIAS